MRPNCLCGETLQGRPYRFLPTDCYQILSPELAALVAKDNSPLLKNTLVRYCNSTYGVCEFDLVLDEFGFILGRVVYKNGEFKILTPNKEIIDLPRVYFNIWEPYTERIHSLYSHHVSPTVDLIDSEGKYVASIFVSSLCYANDTSVVCKNKKAFMSFNY